MCVCRIERTDNYEIGNYIRGGKLFRTLPPARRRANVPVRRAALLCNIAFLSSAFFRSSSTLNLINLRSIEQTIIGVIILPIIVGVKYFTKNSWYYFINGCFGNTFKRIKT